MITSLIIEGKNIDLVPLPKEELKGLWLEAKWTFNYYHASFMGHELMMLEPKKGKSYTPLRLEIFAKRLESYFNKTVIFLLQPIPTYLRQRLADRGIYFVISGKYALLPFLYANRKMTDRIPAKKLTPSAQFVMLWHLQQNNIEGKTARDLEREMPLSYITISRAITTLQELELCKCEKIGKSNFIHISNDKKDLWEQAKDYLMNPIKDVVYCDSYQGDAVTGGINALAHYSHLNPEEMQTIVVTSEGFKRLTLTNANPADGNVRVEVWKYPPIAFGNYVDRLSLALTLEEDNDDRVQKEVEDMIDRVWFTE